jgi:hypothetical protein
MASNRMVTLDIVRGLCIMGMVGVHIFRRTYDLTWLGTEAMADKSMLHLVTLFLIAYIGGMAGLFLMVSTVSHTLSIREQLRAGKPLNGVIVKQMIAGFLLLAFAFFVESVLGQHGFFGRMAYTPLVGDMSFGESIVQNASVILYRGFHFMTLHTIAWAIIVNSVIQWFLLRKGGVEKVSRNVKVYLGLIVGVIILSPIMWAFASYVVPGYPFATYPGTDRIVQYPIEGVSTVVDYVILFALGPLAGQTEPLFPFLFISFIGAIVGLYLSMDRPPKYLPHKGMKIGGAMLFIGLFGILIMLATGIDSIDNIMGDPYGILQMNIWLPLLLFTTGGQLMFLMMLIRMIEYRNISEKAAQRTVMIRRFAVVSLTVYTFQWMDALVLHIVSHIPGVSVFNGRDDFFWAIFSVIAVLVFWNIILRLWEKADFRGSAEWALSVVMKQANNIIKGGRSTSDGARWYLVPKLNVLRDESKVRWMDLMPNDLTGPDKERDSRMSYWLSIVGLVFIPFLVPAYVLAKNSIGTEGPNRFNALSMRISRIGMGWASMIVFYMSQVKGFVLGG